MLGPSLRLVRRAPEAIASAAALALWCGPASAGTFTEDGTFVFDPSAIVTFDFEEPLPAAPDAGDAGSEAVLEADDEALAGGKVLVLGPFQSVDLPVELPEVARSYRVSLWIRGGEAVAALTAAYAHEGRADSLGALYPTGRVTSDGWVELANTGLRVDGARLLRATLGVFSPGGAEIDAIEIVPEDPIDAADPPLGAPCAGAVDPSACGAEQVCLWSECRDAGGWVPPIPADRDAVTDYLQNRVELLFGPFLERTVDLPAARVAFDQMRAATDRWTYWNGFTMAIRRLHDGHTTTSGVAEVVLESPKPISVCFLEGDADLSHDVAPKHPQYLDVLVSHTGADHHLGLAPGDRLVRVDGQHPIAWARSLSAVHWSQPAISNHETFAELASGLPRLVSAYAHVIEVVRCDAALGTCGPIETISIADLPKDEPGAPFDYVACDNRPKRHLPDSPANHASEQWNSVYSGIVVESDAEERIYGLEWESLYSSGSDGVAPGLKQAVATWKADARGVILDHRLGTGGTIVGPKILWAFSVPHKPNDYYEDRQHGEDEQPSPEQGIAIFEQALASGLVTYAGSAAPVTDVPVALLVTQDVSASDWLALGMKGAPKVKIFGPYQTNGAFSTRYSFGYWLGINYVIAVGDTFLPDGTTMNGRGVEPDVVVLPKQSDLLAGKDTVYEAALAWVREELAP